MITFNIAQIAFLAAKIHGANSYYFAFPLSEILKLTLRHLSVYFTGSFIREHPVIMEVISFGLAYFSKNDTDDIRV